MLQWWVLDCQKLCASWLRAANISNTYVTASFQKEVFDQLLILWDTFLSAVCSDTDSQEHHSLQGKS